MLVKMQNIALLFMMCWVQGCGKEPWNDPYPQFRSKQNTLYSAFSERPKHLDPAISYSAEESIFTYQIYEPPLQYHYLKRPYELVTLSASEMPTVRYLNKNREEISNKEESAFSVYRIKIKPGILYQPHPAFVKDPNTHQYLYHDLTAATVAGKHTLNAFQHQDTRELIAEDYVYEIKRLADPTLNSPIFGVMANYIEGFKEFSEDLKKAYYPNGITKKLTFVDLRNIPMTGVNIIDRYTFDIVIKGKYPQFPNWLSMTFFAPIPWEAAKFYSQPLLLERNISLDWYPVGTGPFTLAENNPNLQMILKKNPNFHGENYPTEGDRGDQEKGYLKNAGKPLPFVNAVVFVLERESIPYWNKFMQGYYDQAGVTSNNFDQALKSIGSGNLILSDELKSKNIQLSTAVQPTIYYWGFNMLDDMVGGLTPQKKKLRQAIAIALDMEEYTNIFLNGIGIAAHGPLPPGIFGYEDEGINRLVYDVKPNQQVTRKSIAEAKKLLAEAGYPDGIDPKTHQPLILYLDSTISGGPDSAALQSWLRKQFEKIGIDLVIRGTQYNRFQDKMRSGDFQIFSWGWGADYPDPENFLFLFYSKNAKVKYGGENISNYSNPVFDQLFEKMKIMENSPERNELVKKMVAIVREDAPWIGGYFPELYTLRQQWVDPVKPNAMSRNTIKYIAIDPMVRAHWRDRWNVAIVWPLGVLGGILVLICIPAAITYWQKTHRPMKLEKAQSLKE
ncbi:MAG: ABC transporter substrate-binding protein [Candidatus Berkiellales bacterium]